MQASHLPHDVKIKIIDETVTISKRVIIQDEDGKDVETYDRTQYRKSDEVEVDRITARNLVTHQPKRAEYVKPAPAKKEPKGAEGAK